MPYIELKTQGIPPIRFSLYEKESPATCKGFVGALPFATEFVQARFAGEEIWAKEGPLIDIPQENATINLQAGEMGFAPRNPRNEVAGSIAIRYGDGKLADCVNVFAKVYDEDLGKLKQLGEKIWLEGKKRLTLELK